MGVWPKDVNKEKVVKHLSQNTDWKIHSLEINDGEEKSTVQYVWEAQLSLKKIHISLQITQTNIFKTLQTSKTVKPAQTRYYGLYFKCGWGWSYYKNFWGSYVTLPQMKILPGTVSPLLSFHLKTKNVAVFTIFIGTAFKKILSVLSFLVNFPFSKYECSLIYPILPILESTENLDLEALILSTFTTVGDVSTI